MIEIQYSLTIEATADPEIFGFYSPDLPGFSGIGHSIEDCIYKAKWGMLDHIEQMKDRNLEVPLPNQNPKIMIQNEEIQVSA